MFVQGLFKGDLQPNDGVEPLVWNAVMIDLMDEYALSVAQAIHASTMRKFHKLKMNFLETVKRQEAENESLASSEDVCTYVHVSIVRSLSRCQHGGHWVC